MHFDVTTAASCLAIGNKRTQNGGDDIRYENRNDQNHAYDKSLFHKSSYPDTMRKQQAHRLKRV